LEQDRIYTFEGVAPVLPEDGDYWVAPGARVIGRVVLHKGASIWFNAVLRGDNEVIQIGAEANIQDGVICHTDPGLPLTVGAGCTIGHLAILHGCTIGTGSLIGMGSTVLNGAVIGERALIGAGSLVTEGREIPGGVLAVGRPARPVRDLTPDEIAGLAASAAGYRDKMIRFRDGLGR